jgi:hypothetical protein
MLVNLARADGHGGSAGSSRVRIDGKGAETVVSFDVEPERRAGRSTVGSFK